MMACWAMLMQIGHHKITGAPYQLTYIFQIDGGSISRSCQKQNIVALSSTEAEFIALTHATKEALWLQHFITEVIQPLKSPI